MSFNAKALMAVVNAVGILAGKIAFGKTEVMDRVQQIGLAYAVAAADPGEPLRKTVLLVKIVFELI